MRDRLQSYLKKKELVKQRDYSKQHAKGRLSPMERVELLFDPGTFVEMGMLAEQDLLTRRVKEESTPRDGHIVGYGKVNGRYVGVVADDITVKYGSLGRVGFRKIEGLGRLCTKQGFPLVWFLEGSGARLEDEESSLVADVDETAIPDLCALSGYVPIVMAVMGPCVGGHANFTALGDFVPMTKGSNMSIIGAPVLRSKLSIEISDEDVGGVKVHCDKSGMADLAVGDDRDCIDKIKGFLSYLPSNCNEAPPIVKSNDDPERRDERLLDLVPTDLKRPYDMKRLIEYIVDDGKFFELKPTYARNIVTCLARMDGKTVGIVANQPLYMAGTLDVKAASKASRFYNFCDAFGIPLIFLADIPGFFPAPESEINGIIRWSTRMLYEIAHATVPKIAVLVRKAFGLGAFGMCTPHFRPECTVAWPTALIGAISPEDAVDILYKRKLAERPDKEKARSELIRNFEERMRVDAAVEAGFYDDVIDPRDTRRVIIRALGMAKGRQEGFTFKRRGITPI